jgi:HSP20 family protein
MVGLIRFDPFKEIERMFSDDFFPALLPTFKMSDVAVDIYETDDALVVEAAIPGVDAKNVKVKVEDNLLRLSGKFEKKDEVKEDNYWRKEMRRGEFVKTVALPYVVDPETAKAKFDNGVLKVTFAKPKAQERGKEIVIE